MNILWISGRRLGHDLADTTEIGIFESVNKKNDHEITMISPGSMSDWGKNHIKIKTLNLPGLVTISGSLHIRIKIGKILKNNNFDVIMIDWRYVSLISRILKKSKIPWLIIDRGPPTKQNWKLRFQKKMWEKSWKISNECAMAGIIVSDEHNLFVKKYAKINKNNIVIYSGTSFPPGKVKSLENGDRIDLIYVGQIDKRRDMKSILKLKKELDKNDMKNNIYIVGEGDDKISLEKEIKNLENIKIFGKKNKAEIKKLLDSCHIGILPMPDTPIWRMASPIKLAEYARSGLLTIGPRHPGNAWNFPTKWEILSSDDEWWIEAPKNIKEKISEKKWSDYSKNAIEDSKSRSWDYITDTLLSEMKEYISN